MIYLTAEQILFIHARLVAETGGSHGVHDLRLLLSAIGRPQASFEQQDLYPDLFSKVAALFDSLIRNHAFIDGNKRTAISASALFLQANGDRLSVTHTEMVDFTLQAVQGGATLDEIIVWFQSHTKSSAG